MTTIYDRRLKIYNNMIKFSVYILPEHIHTIIEAFSQSAIYTFFTHDCEIVDIFIGKKCTKILLFRQNEDYKISECLKAHAQPVVNTLLIT